MARHREVFPTSEIPHKWAHAAQDSARNPQGNLYFRGATLYSNCDIYPIARIYKKKKRPSVGDNGPSPLLDATVREAHAGLTLVLHVEDTYSATTAQHCHAARIATSHLPSITVPEITSFGRDLDKSAHGRNLEHLAELAKTEFGRAQRAQRENNAVWRANAARKALADFAAYCAFFGIRRKAPAIHEAEYAAAIERARKIENPDPASADKRERNRARRNKLAAIKAQRDADLRSLRQQAYRTDWRLYGAFGATHSHSFMGMRDAVMLRVNGEQIETSQGARIPLAAAPMVWNLVERAIARGGWKPSGLSAVKIGDYAVSEIRADGTLVVGCHEIPHSELRSMARQLGLS